MVRAAVMKAPQQPLEVAEFALPRLEDGAVLLRTIYSEVCGTDVHLHQGHLAGVPYPIIPGHINVGEIVDLAGAPVDLDGQPLRKGQVATFLDVHETCGHCWYCTVAKTTTRCPHRKVYGITYSARDGPAGRLVGADLPETGRQGAAAARQCAAAALYRRWLRPAHRRARHRTRPRSCWATPWWCRAAGRWG